MNADRIKAILKDEDFLALVAKTRQALTKKVMRKAATDEDRAAALAEYHALDSLIAQMGSQAHNLKDNQDE